MPKNIIYTDSLASQLVDFLNKDVLLGALKDENIEQEVCFDCKLWNDGYTVNKYLPCNCSCGSCEECLNSSSYSVIIPSISSTFICLLTEIETFLKSELCNFSCTNFAYKTQIQRLLYIVSDLKSKALAIQCNSPFCDLNLLAFLLSTLIDTILLLVSILEIINGLLTYTTTGNCGCSSTKVVELFMGRLINKISELQMMLPDWYGLVINFMYYSTTTPRPYIASYVPRQPILPPPPKPPMTFACVPNPQRPPTNQNPNYAHCPSNMQNNSSYSQFQSY